jgi:hypothetical protein
MECKSLMKPLPKNFQKLTKEDESTYGHPEFIYLEPTIVNDPNCMDKRTRWIKWRAAPYEAKRHSEYLYIPDIDEAKEPRILVSAVMQTPNTIEEYLASISRKRRYDISGKKALNLGYTSREIDPKNEALGIWEIIHSSDSRQGRKIAADFFDRPPNFDFPAYKTFHDPNYEDICCGVFSKTGDLSAYLLGKRVGHHVQYDEIMGHAEHLKNDVMYLLHFSFLKICTKLQIPPACLNYGPWYSGVAPYSSTGGLNRWKRKVKFKPAYLILASY